MTQPTLARHTTYPNFNPLNSLQIHNHPPSTIHILYNINLLPTTSLPPSKSLPQILSPTTTPYPLSILHIKQTPLHILPYQSNPSLPFHNSTSPSPLPIPISIPLPPNTPTKSPPPTSHQPPTLPTSSPTPPPHSSTSLPSPHTHPK